ncbi:hypothetical protein DNTS_005860 [Danionella cerebrum]|uniref:Uncharacterized protein n=1 Tax=Danionella cerebrum TaxID=2873325 RepID=A0A553PXY3_9TELE|nr:hypothetical protein DNTS_005860 [Danionella translucida]
MMPHMINVNGDASQQIYAIRADQSLLIPSPGAADTAAWLCFVRTELKENQTLERQGDGRLQRLKQQQQQQRQQQTVHVFVQAGSTVGAHISRAGAEKWEVCLLLHHQECEETQGSFNMSGQLYHVYRHVCTLNNLFAENMMVSSLQQKMAHIWFQNMFFGSCGEDIFLVMFAGLGPFSDWGFQTELRHVILVQVNPGETFTIRAEDGSLQCIQGMPRLPFDQVIAVCEYIIMSSLMSCVEQLSFGWFTVGVLPTLYAK